MKLIILRIFYTQCFFSRLNLENQQSKYMMYLKQIMNMKPLILYKTIFLDGFIFVYNVYVFVHVSTVIHYAWVKQGQRATSDDGPWLPFCLRQGFLLFAAMYTRLAGLQIWRSSCVCLPSCQGSTGVTQTLPGFLRQTFCCHGQKQRQTRNEWVWQCASAAFNLWVLGFKFYIIPTGENIFSFQLSSWVYISCRPESPFIPNEQSLFYRIYYFITSCKENWIQCFISKLDYP